MENINGSLKKSEVFQIRYQGEGYISYSVRH